MSAANSASFQIEISASAWSSRKSKCLVARCQYSSPADSKVGSDRTQ